MLNLKEKLGIRIRKFRKELGYSQEKLAELIGMDIPNLSNIERGKRFMTAETLEKLAISLKTTERELFNFNEIEPSKYYHQDINAILNYFNEDELEFTLNFLKNYLKIRK